MPGTMPLAVRMMSVTSVRVYSISGIPQSQPILADIRPHPSSPRDCEQGMPHDAWRDVIQCGRRAYWIRIPERTRTRRAENRDDL